MDKKRKNSIILRRGELLSQLFLEELEPIYLARVETAKDIGYDYFVGFSNPRGGLNTYGVEIKATERPINERYPLNNGVLEKLAFANIPSLLLVIDVKQNQLFYSWLADGQSNSTLHDPKTRSVPLVYLDEDEKAKLKDQMISGVMQRMNG